MVRYGSGCKPAENGSISVLWGVYTSVFNQAQRRGNTMKKHCQLYEIGQVESGKYLVRVDGVELRRFDTLEEAWDFCVEHANRGDEV